MVIMVTNLPRRLPEAVLALLLCGVSAPAAAAETYGAVSAGVGVSDNLTRSTVKKNQAITTLGLQFGAREQSRRLKLDVDSDLSWLSYPGSTYGSEVVGQLRGETSLAIVPERLNWTVRDVFGQTRRRLYDPLTPDNRENINQFATGPRIILGLGGIANLLIAATYTRTDQELRQLNSQSVGLDIAIQRWLSSHSAVSLHAMREHIDLEPSSGYADYDRDAAYLNYTLTGADTTLELKGGASRLLLESQTLTSPMVSMQLNRRIGQRTRWFLSGGREFTHDAAQMGVSVVARWAPTLDNSSQTRSVEAFRRTHAGSGLGLQGARTTMVVDFIWSEDSFEASPTLDRRRLTARSTVYRQLLPRLGLRAGGTWTNDSYIGSGLGLRELSVTAGLDLRLTRNLYADFTYDGYQTTPLSGAPGLVGNENRVWLRLRYGASRGLISGTTAK